MKKLVVSLLTVMMFLMLVCCGGKKEADATEARKDKEIESTEEGENKNIPESAIQAEADDETKNDVEGGWKLPILLTPTLIQNIEFAIYSEDIFCIYNGKKYGYMKRTGEEITDYIYDAGFPFSEGVACVVSDGKYGYIDTEGKEVIPFLYDDAASFMEGLAYFSLDGKYGFMEADGTVAFYLDCDSTSSFQEGLAYVSVDGKYGYIDKSGKIVIQPIYMDADYFEGGIAFVNKDGCKGAINSRGDEVIPVKYDNIYRSDGFVIAEIGDEREYYSLSGVKVSQKEYESQMTSNIEMEDSPENTDNTEEIAVTMESDFVRVCDKNGEEIISVKYDYDSHAIYNDYKNYILKQYDGTDHILLLEEIVNVDHRDVLLKNSITPRIGIYWDLTHGINVNVINRDKEVVNVSAYNSWNEFEYIKNFKLIDLEQSDTPVLYCYEEPVIRYGFPMSSSDLYGMINNQLCRLVTGYECGGSARGDYVCLWKDAESGRILPGTNGSAGGFGGFAVYSYVYDNIAGELQQIYMDEYIRQYTSNYEPTELLENASLYYDDENIPYTKDTIQEAEYVNEYLINQERVLIEEYQNANARYRLFDIF